jgi:hypothetical protein
MAQPSDAVLTDDLAQKFLRAGGLTLDRFERTVFLPGNPAGIELYPAQDWGCASGNGARLWLQAGSLSS